MNLHEFMSLDISKEKFKEVFKKEYNLYNPFNIKCHNETFINYFETIIDEDGLVIYAIPSHQEALIAFSCKKLNKTRQEIINECPKEYFFSALDYLTEISGYIACWSDNYIGKANEKQIETLRLLKENNIYNGEIFKNY